MQRRRKEKGRKGKRSLSPSLSGQREEHSHSTFPLLPHRKHCHTSTTKRIDT
jgi:hypothetical protein